MDVNPESNMVGVFDSGVGGLSILKAMKELIPGQPLVYFADQAHVPYGSRSLIEVQKFSEEVSRFLIGLGARMIVVACNTASAAALYHLRKNIPDIPFVGMEPAIKPAVEGTQTGKVGVLATPATFQGELFASLEERFSKSVRIFKDTCPGLVAEIESGHLDKDTTRTILENALLPMVSQNVDSIVLGCTHYPFVLSLIKEIVGEGVQVIDPSLPVARQARRILESRGILAGSDVNGDTRLITSGDVHRFRDLATRLTGWHGIHAEQASWVGETLCLNQE